MVDVGLTEDLRAAYWRDGFVRGIPVLSISETAAARARLLAVEADERHKRGGTWPDRDFYPWEQADHPLWELYWELATHPRLLAAVRSVLGPDVLIRNGDVFIKEPHDPDGVCWHLDTPERDGTQDAFVTAWLGLGVEGSTTRNGGMWFLRGAHRAELLERPPDKEHLDLSDRTIAALAPAARVANFMPAGFASLHHALLPHRSGGNQTPHRRIGFVVRYLGAGISRPMAGSGVACLACGRFRSDAIAQRERFPVTWSPRVP